MTKDEIIDMAESCFIKSKNQIEFIELFADRVARYEREKLEGQIQTLHAMYELASKQRDALMDEQRAQVAAMRGRIQ
jgi:hypothetical protein